MAIIVFKSILFIAGLGNILFLDFLDHVSVETETLAILRVFCHMASQALQVMVCIERSAARHVRTRLSFRS